MEDVVAATTRIVVLKKGRMAGEMETARVDARMLGEAIMSGIVEPPPPPVPFVDDEVADEPFG
jgi:hypothetical protein